MLLLLEVLAAVVADLLAVVAEHLARPQPHLGPVAPGHATAIGILGSVVRGSLWSIGNDIGTEGAIYLFSLFRRVSTNVKYVSKVRGQLCDSRKSYIASVTIHPEGRQFHATDKICKKVQEIVYWCGH